MIVTLPANRFSEPVLSLSSISFLSIDVSLSKLTGMQRYRWSQALRSSRRWIGQLFVLVHCPLDPPSFWWLFLVLHGSDPISHAERTQASSAGAFPSSPTRPPVLSSSRIVTSPGASGMSDPCVACRPHTHGSLCGVSGYSVRQSIRKKYGLPADDLGDFLTAWCCAPCFTIQNTILLAKKKGGGMSLRTCFCSLSPSLSLDHLSLV